MSLPRGRYICFQTLLSLLILVPVISAQTSPITPSPVGTYITIGGNGCFKIDKNPDDSLSASGSILDEHYFRVRMSGLAIIIESKLKENLFTKGSYFEQRTPSDVNRPWDGYYELVPSTLRHGDWDLVKYRSPYTLFNMEPGLWDSTMNEKMDWPPLDAPTPLMVPQFLHRVNDEKLIAYFDQRHEIDYDDQSSPLVLRSMTVSLLAVHPDDLWIQLLDLDALLRVGDWDELKQKLALWETGFLASPNPDIRERVPILRHALHVADLSASGQNAFDYIHKHLTGDQSGTLDERQTALQGLMQYH